MSNNKDGDVVDESAKQKPKTEVRVAIVVVFALLNGGCAVRRDSGEDLFQFGCLSYQEQQLEACC